MIDKMSRMGGGSGVSLPILFILFILSKRALQRRRSGHGTGIG